MRFLIVDDSDLMLRAMRAVIESIDGHTVVAEARDGLKALIALEGGSVDAAVMDVDMPTLDGLAALRTLRESNPVLPVLMCSGAGEAVASACMDAGATAFCPKEELCSTLSEMLRRLGLGHETRP